MLRIRKPLAIAALALAAASLTGCYSSYSLGYHSGYRGYSDCDLGYGYSYKYKHYGHKRSKHHGHRKHRGYGKHHGHHGKHHGGYKYCD